jgi:hypothetical protein
VNYCSMVMEWMYEWIGSTSWLGLTLILNINDRSLYILNYGPTRGVVSFVYSIITVLSMIIGCVSLFGRIGYCCCFCC